VAFVVVYDACVLYPAQVRDLLITVATLDLVQAKWTDRILDEMVESILRDRPDLTRDQLERTRNLMCEAIRDCMVTGYAGLIDALTLPDPDDRHVLAAAIRAGAQTIVTENLKDFPPEELDAYAIEAVHPDEFLCGLMDLDPERVIEALIIQGARLKAPAMTPDQLLERMRARLPRVVARARSFVSSGPPMRSADE
jgi:hypothetical protein